MKGETHVHLCKRAHADQYEASTSWCQVFSRSASCKNLGSGRKGFKRASLTRTKTKPNSRMRTRNAKARGKSGFGPLLEVLEGWKFP